MKLGGIIFCCLGIVIVVLVANGRWATVWAAALGTQPGSSAYSGPSVNAGSFGTWGSTSGGDSWGAATDTAPTQTATGGGW